MILSVNMNIEIDSEAKDDIVKAFTHHIEQIMSLDEWPEIKYVYGVEVVEVQ